MQKVTGDGVMTEISNRHPEGHVMIPDSPGKSMTSCLDSATLQWWAGAFISSMDQRESAKLYSPTCKWKGSAAAVKRKREMVTREEED